MVINNQTSSSAQHLPPDDLTRQLVIARPNENNELSHIALVGDVYTILLHGKDTGGHYSLIDMHIPAGGGPGPHRHDFEEMFSVLEGAIELTFRGSKVMVKAGETVNVPANAPHFFRNVADRPARMLCMCTPPGQEDFFTNIGCAVGSRIGPAPELDEAAKKEQKEKIQALAPQYRTELL